MNKTLVDISLAEYQREYDRKSKLDSKTIGYITFLSILMATSIGLFGLCYVGIENIYLKLITICFLFIEMYFTIWALVYSLVAHQMRDLENVNLKHIVDMWNLSDDIIDGSLIKTIEVANAKNKELNKEIENKNQIIYMFLGISVLAFIVLSAWTIIVLIGGIK
jgi:hypothetical protein